MAVVVAGDKALIAKLERFRKLDIFARSFDDAGQTVAATARALAPVGEPSDGGRAQPRAGHPGRLKASIAVKRRKADSLKSVIQAGRYMRDGYAPIVHYAQFQKRSPQPFLTQAFAIANSTYVEIKFDAGMSAQMRASGF